MPSLSHTFLRISAENMSRSILNTKQDNIPALRNWLDLSASALTLPRGVQSEMVEMDQYPAEWFTPKKCRTDRVILFLHGGGFSVGSLITHRALAAKVAQQAECKSLIINYRKSPEHPFPAAQEDALHAYRFLLSEGFDSSQIALCGDSAGGGLCMTLLLKLKELGIAMPAAAVLFSPWVDLTFSGESADQNQPRDPIVKVDHLRDWADSYANGLPLDHPMISPLFGDLSDLPPILIQASDAEVLTDDAVRLGRNLARAHSPSHLQLYPGLLHVWQLFWRYTPEANEALEHAGTFVRKKMDHAQGQAPTPQPPTSADNRDNDEGETPSDFRIAV